MTPPPPAGKAPAADEEDDLDDLDELVDQFTSPAQPTGATVSTATGKTSVAPLTDSSAAPAPASASVSAAATAAPAASVEDDESDDGADEPDEFARDLAEGMDALFQSMQSGDDAAFAKQFEALMRGDPDAAAALFDAPKTGSPGSGGGAAAGSGSDSRAAEGAGAGGQKSFQDTIMETMNKLKESDTSATEQSRGDDDTLAAMMEQFMGAAGGSGQGSDEDLQSMLQGFMDELMSKPVMYPPMKELNDKYPNWLASNKSSVSKAELDRYTTQAQIISDVIVEFEDPGWDRDEELAKSTAAGANKAKESLKRRQGKVTELMTRMQECGAPPKELLGDMPPGLELGEDGLPNPEQCCIS